MSDVSVLFAVVVVSPIPASVSARECGFTIPGKIEDFGRSGLGLEFDEDEDDDDDEPQPAKDKTRVELRKMLYLCAFTLYSRNEWWNYKWIEMGSRRKK